MSESLIDVVRNVQQLLVTRGQDPALPFSATAADSAAEPETWRWATRRCGPCAVHACDLDIVDSATHYEMPLLIAEPHHHICKLTSPVILELEVEFACCSEVEWETSPLFEKYR